MVGSRILRYRLVLACVLVGRFRNRAIFSHGSKKIISLNWGGECPNSMVGSRVLRNRRVLACVLVRLFRNRAVFSHGSKKIISFVSGWGMPQLDGWESNCAEQARSRLHSSRAVSKLSGFLVR